MAISTAVRGIRRARTKRSGWARPRGRSRGSLPHRTWRAFRRSPTAVRVLAVLLASILLSLSVNFLYQVLRKPSELLFPVSGTLYKTPPETWRRYEPLFRRYSTGIMTPDLLAAMAQVEGSGNPVARTYWRWSWKLHPFEIYRPASSAVGMYQITDGNFAEARRFCIRDHAVADAAGGSGCWFSRLYTRVLPADAVELTSAYLDHSVTEILGRRGLAGTSLHRKQELAAMIHLCGAGAGDVFARRGFKLTGGQRCGDHEVSAYLARVNAMRGVFDRIAGEPKNPLG